MDFPARGRVAALVCVLAVAGAAPASADSTTYVLTPSWQKIAGTGTSVEVQNTNAAGVAVLSTASGGPPSTPGGQALGPGEYRRYTLAADLYALGTVPLIVTTGLATAPSAVTTSSLAASGGTVALAVDGMNTGLVQIGTGSWTGTIVFEASADGGSTWTGVNMVPYAGGLATGATTAGGLWEMAVGGLTHLRVRATTAIASGPATVILRATNGLKSLRVGAPSANPLPIATPIPATVVTGQVKIATTGTAVCLPANALVNGLAIKARATNAANLLVGPSGVTTTYDGTGNGYPIEPGAAASFATANSSAVCLNGTAGDIASYEGN